MPVGGRRYWCLAEDWLPQAANRGVCEGQNRKECDFAEFEGSPAEAPQVVSWSAEVQASWPFEHAPTSCPAFPGNRDNWRHAFVGSPATGVKPSCGSQPLKQKQSSADLIARLS